MPTALPLAQLLDCGQGRHFASGPHLRVQAVRLSPGDAPRDYAKAHHGDVLVVCLRGRARVETTDGILDLAEHDQALLDGVPPFRLAAVEADTVAQLIWAPGPNPCRECWELNDRFFADE